MPTPTGMLKHGDRIYHKEHPDRIFVVVQRYGNRRNNYSITYRNDDRTPVRVRWLTETDWQMRHNGWRVVE